MATTTSANLIVPDVWADAVGPTILGRSVFAQIADVDDTLVGQPGETVIVPKWDYIGDAVDLTENVAMTTTTMTMTDSRAVIKEVGKALELTDTAVLTALGNPNGEAQRQLAIAVARKIDTDLRIAAELTETVNDSFGVSKTYAPLAVGLANLPLSWGRLVQGFGLMGDEYDPSDIAGIVVHSVQHAQLMVDPLFVDASKFGEGTAVQRGQVGRIGTIPVFVSDRATAIADVDPGAGTVTGYRALIIKRGALKLLYKRRPIVETDRDILKRTNIITTNVHYAAKRVDDRGVIIVPTNGTAPVPA